MEHCLTPRARRVDAPPRPAGSFPSGGPSFPSGGPSFPFLHSPSQTTLSHPKGGAAWSGAALARPGDAPAQPGGVPTPNCVCRCSCCPCCPCDPGDEEYLQYID